MTVCELCNDDDYHVAFEVPTGGTVHVLDGPECAARQLPPVCTDCQCHTLGHGPQAEGQFSCCAHCARRQRFAQLVDHT